MAKKKSKTQKYKKKQKKKLQKGQVKSPKKVVKKNTQPKTEVKKSEQSKKIEPKVENRAENKEQPKKINKNQIVSKEKVNYNVVLAEENRKQIEKTNKIKIQEIIKEEKKLETKEQTKKENKFKKSIQNIKANIVSKKQTKIKENKKAVYVEKNIKKDLLKLETPKENIKKKNIIIRLFYEIKNNMHIIFNTIIIVTFIILLIGLIRINVLQKGTIIYICSIVLFLMLVAISYNRYLSGKVFTLLITAGMCVGIYYMQYTYDFIRNLNTNVYEYKTYYVVAFDTAVNRSIYTINNKKVGLLTENCVNIERKLNTKLDKVHYIEYDDMNKLFQDFYKSEFKAILVNENQYNYLKNNIEENSRKIKILYEFKANARK